MKEKLLLIAASRRWKMPKCVRSTRDKSFLVVFFKKELPALLSLADCDHIFFARTLVLWRRMLLGSGDKMLNRGV
jgi:hypothetical protein